MFPVVAVEEDDAETVVDELLLAVDDEAELVVELEDSEEELVLGLEDSEEEDSSDELVEAAPCIEDSLEEDEPSGNEILVPEFADDTPPLANRIEAFEERMLRGTVPKETANPNTNALVHESANTTRGVRGIEERLGMVSR